MIKYEINLSNRPGAILQLIQKVKRLHRRRSCNINVAQPLDELVRRPFKQIQLDLTGNGAVIAVLVTGPGAAAAIFFDIGQDLFGAQDNIVRNTGQARHLDTIAAVGSPSTSLRKKIISSFHSLTAIV